MYNQVVSEVRENEFTFLFFIFFCEESCVMVALSFHVVFGGSVVASSFRFAFCVLRSGFTCPCTSIQPPVIIDLYLLFSNFVLEYSTYNRG